jgi:tetratricopeptide (TPR) repeat protein
VYSPLYKTITVLLLQAGVLLAQNHPAPSKPQAAQEQGQLDASPALFAVMAAINVAGYDAEIDSTANHPFRKQLRAELLAKNLPIYEELRAFYRNHRQKSAVGELSQYVSFALSVDGPPNFNWRFKPSELPPDVAEMQGFDLLVARFYKEANIADLWDRAQPAIEQVLERYHSPVMNSVLEVNAYLRQSTIIRTDRGFQIFVDLLGAPNQIQTRSYAGDYYIVLTPSQDPQVNDIRHVYLHYVLDPIAMRAGEALEKKRALVDFAQPAPLLAPYYKSDFVLLAGASAVRAVEARLSPQAKRPAMIDEAMKQGFILTAAFAEELARYEKQEQSMRLYFSEMVTNIDLKKEDRRLMGIEFATERTVRKAKPGPKAVEPELSPVEKKLEEAEGLYKARELDKARAVFLGVLEQTAEKPMHAKAYYGLARIAAMQKDPELSEKLFIKTLDLSPDGQTKAWCHVYLARLSEAAGKGAERAGQMEEAAKERDQAAEHYRAALAVEGASDGAKQAAQTALAAAGKK